MAWFHVKVDETQVKEPVFEVSISGGWPNDLFWLPVLHLTGALLDAQIFQSNTMLYIRNIWVLRGDWFWCRAPTGMTRPTQMYHGLDLEVQSFMIMLSGDKGALLESLPHTRCSCWGSSVTASGSLPVQILSRSRSPLHLVVHDKISRKVHMVMKWMLASSRYEVPVVIMHQLLEDMSTNDDFVVLAWHHKDKGDAFFFIGSCVKSYMHLGWGYYPLQPTSTTHPPDEVLISRIALAFLSKPSASLFRAQAMYPESVLQMWVFSFFKGWL